ncbi:MAG: tetratricopeptide repeat protein [Anaerolineae bacterium]|nr:tetratricopeptide repeat protein [Anaerolineae bacterium]
MAGDQQRFQQAMEAGTNATWDENWTKAVEAFMVAVKEFPQEVQAVNSLGFALYQAGRLEDALRVYGQAHRLASDDPIPVEKSADVLERLGRASEAAKQYLTVAEIYLQRQDLEKAIDNWKRATHITPGLVKIHQRMAQAYIRLGNRIEAANQYLKMAYHFQKASNQPLALQVLERAQQLLPKEPTILNAITAVRANTELSADLAIKRKPSPAELEAEEPIVGVDVTIADADRRGPIGDAVEVSMEQLATAVFESGNLDLSGAMAMQAIEMHRATIHDQAISAYLQSEQGGLRTASLYLNLGALYVDAQQWDKAIEYLQKVSGDLLMTAGATHGIALAYIGKEDWRQALRHLTNTLRLVDMSLARTDEEQSQLAEIYNRLARLAQDATEDTLKTLSKKFAQRLTGVDWKRRVRQTRQQLEDAFSQGTDNVLEVVAQSDDVIDAMSRIDDYVAQRRFILAMDEAHYVIERAPEYLEAHLRIANVLMEMNQVQKAIAKYNLIAQTYMARGNLHKTADILNRVIKVAPADVRLRENLIELLESQERHADALEQYIQLAETHRDLSDLSSARTIFDQALKLAQRINAPLSTQMRIMHALAHIDRDRLDLRGALRTYQRILEQQADDLDARRAAVDIHFRLNNSVQAMQELDRLLQVYAKQRRPDLILKVLEEEVRANPKEMGLRLRLGQVYHQMKRPADALEQMEALHQLQLEAGLHDEARKTIRQILSLNPSNSAHYQQLLQQLGG